MKSSMLKAIYFGCFIFITVHSYSQVKFGIKGGLSASDIKADDINILNSAGRDSLLLGIKKANLGYHFGLISQIKFKGIVIQPEINFNSTSVEYTIGSNQSTVISQVKKETYKDLDIPLLVGVYAGPVRLIVGPVGHVHLASTSGLLDIDGYKQDFKSVTLGWQGGVGIDFFKTVLLDVRYEGNFSNFGDHVSFFNKDYQFSRKSARLLISASIVL